MNTTLSDQLSLLDQAHQASCTGEDYGKARQLYEQAAQQGEIEALYYLALLYRDGEGVQPDLERAQKLLHDFLLAIRAAANRGEATACLRLGKMLQYGDSLLKNETEAVHWINKAAELGLPEAQFHLSRLYAYGWCGVEKNLTAERLWLNKAVDNGYPEALYIKGVEEANDYLETKEASALASARSWLNQAAERGYSEANTVLELLSRNS